MESHPFIPYPPSSTSSNGLYFTLQICADTSPSSAEVDLCAIYQSQRSRSYPQPDQMLSNTSINLSNISPAKSLAPLPIPCPATPAPPAMSPQTTQSTLAMNPNINAELLHTIANGLLTTITNCETNTTVQYRRFTEQIQSLQDRILQYEQTFERAPDEYTLNDGCIPHFHIPHGDGISCPTKWIKLNDNGTVSGYADSDGPSSLLHIIDLYTESNDQYDDEGEVKPALPILAWFCHLMVGPSADFQLLRNALLIHNNWGLTHEVHHYHDLDDEYADLAIKLKHLQTKLNAVQQAHSSCKSHLQLAHAAEQVEILKNIPCKPQATHSVWKHKSSRHGCPF